MSRRPWLGCGSWTRSGSVPRTGSAPGRASSGWPSSPRHGEPSPSSGDHARQAAQRRRRPPLDSTPCVRANDRSFIYGVPYAVARGRYAAPCVSHPAQCAAPPAVPCLPSWRRHPIPWRPRRALSPWLLQKEKTLCAERLLAISRSRPFEPPYDNVSIMHRAAQLMISPLPDATMKSNWATFSRWPACICELLPQLGVPARSSYSAIRLYVAPPSAAGHETRVDCIEWPQATACSHAMKHPGSTSLMTPFDAHEAPR